MKAVNVPEVQEHRQLHALPAVSAVDELRRRNAELEKAHALVDALLAASGEAPGLAGLVRAIARAIGGRATLEQGIRAPFLLASSPGETDEEVDEWTAPILLGPEPIGSLRVSAPEPFGPADHRVIEHGARLIALELQRDVAELRMDEQLKGELLEELLTDGEPGDARLTRRLARAGLDLSEPHLVVVVRTRSGRAIDARRTEALACLGLRDVQDLRDRLFCVERRGQIVCFIPQSLQDHGPELAEALRRAAATPGETASAGLSGAHISAVVALREAEACAQVACRAADPGTTLDADRLGVLRFALALPDLSAIRSVVDGQLGPLLEHDRTRDACLTDTLKAFLELDGNQAAIAARCHIHVSTVKYRMKRIAEILNRDTRAPHVRFELTLAFKAADLFATTGEDLLTSGDRPRHAG